MGKLVVVSLWMTATLWCQAAPRTLEEILITRIRVVTAENLARLPDYTCLQTIERFERTGPDRPFDLLDKIRLEVALVGGKELFTWPGSGKFDDRNISEIVSRGAIGNGSFALQARNIFVTGNAATFEWVGEVVEDGRRLIRYRYDVPKHRSARLLRVGGDREIVAFHGSFDVDAVTLNLARLEVIVTGIPARLHVTKLTEEMRYSTERIGGSDFLLPRTAVLVMNYANGEASRNVTRFSSCRQYAGESVVRFEEPREPEAVPPPVARRARVVEFAAGTPIFVHLESAIRFGSAAAGDPFQARLERDLRRDGRVIAPKGSVVSGRLTRFEKRRFPRGRGTSARFVDGLIAGMQLTGIELTGTQVPVSAVLDEVRLLLSQRRVLGRMDENAFAVEGLELPTGLLMVWRVRE